MGIVILVDLIPDKYLFKTEVRAVHWKIVRVLGPGQSYDVTENTGIWVIMNWTLYENTTNPWVHK